jgi:hypothetical protein
MSLVGGRNCPRPDGSSQTEVLQLLSREPDRGNRSLASVVGAGKQPRPRGHKGELVAKSVTGSLSPVKPMASEPAQRELWNYYPQRFGGVWTPPQKGVIVVTPVAKAGIIFGNFSENG